MRWWIIDDEEGTEEECELEVRNLVAESCEYELWVHLKDGTVIEACEIFDNHELARIDRMIMDDWSSRRFGRIQR